jgi:hypothetical protein
MPLVDVPQIPQDQGVTTSPTQSTASWDMFKTAGTNTALAELGLTPSETLTKEAALPLLALLGRGAWALGKGLLGAGGRAAGVVARPLGSAGHRAVQAVGQRVGASPARIQQIQRLGKGMAREAVGFGALSGGLEAAMADPGQRGQAFLRGAAGGALGGLAWRGAGNLARAGLQRGLGAGAGGAARLGRLSALQQQPWLKGQMPLGQRARGWGAKALMGGVPFAAGLGASMMMPTFHGGDGQTTMQRFAPYAARAAGGAMMGALPQHPMGYAYNPNLPMPQYGY